PLHRREVREREASEIIVVFSNSLTVSFPFSLPPPPPPPPSSSQAPTLRHRLRCPPALFSSLRGNRNSHFWLALSPMRASLLKLDLAFLRPLISFVAAMVRIGSVSTDGSDASPVGSPDHASSEIQRQPSDDGMINCLGPAVSPRISNKKLLNRV
ncbi:unnamed protein product, partial [Prunus brigantina]